jgi:hypothetical protein
MTDTNHRYCTLGSSVKPKLFEVNGIDPRLFGKEWAFLKRPGERSSLKVTMT